MFFLHFDYWQVVEVDDGRKTNVWSTNKFSKEMHTAVLVTFSPPSSVQSKMVKNALIYNLTAEPMERGEAKE